jgi:hypothetical protein
MIREATGQPMSEPKRKGKINAEWHGKNRMPKNPTPAPRVKWHIAHEKACACRTMPASIKALIAASK